MERSLFDVVMEAAAKVAEAGPSARPFRPYPREDRAPVVRLESAAPAVPPRDYALPAGRVRVVVAVGAVRKGGKGK
jgi:hypothetical protein